MINLCPKLRYCKLRRLQRRSRIFRSLQRRDDRRLHLHQRLADCGLWQQGRNWCMRDAGSICVVWLQRSLHGAVHECRCFWLKVRRCMASPCYLGSQTAWLRSHALDVTLRDVKMQLCCKLRTWSERSSWPDLRLDDFCCRLQFYCQHLPKWNWLRRIRSQPDVIIYCGKQHLSKEWRYVLHLAIVN